MSAVDWLQIIAVLGLVTLLTPPLGGYMAAVFSGEETVFSFFLRPAERWIYRLVGTEEREEMSGRAYAVAVLIFSGMSIVALFLMQILQDTLPLNPAGLKGTSWHLAFNTAVSFVTNTNWQSYAGETTLTYFTQMVGLTVQNFLSAAVGFAVFLVIIRGLTRKNSNSLGNFWVDMTRTVLYILLPAALLWAVLLVSQGVVQNFDAPVHAVTVEGTVQVLPQGPAASQIAIKQLGTNGGGYFNANSAHPFENPTPFSNFLETLALILLPAGLTYTFGVMVGNRRQGWMIFATMMGLLMLGLFISLWSEGLGNPLLGTGAVMEGKETRFGTTSSIIWSTLTTCASNGSVNAMHSSLSPLAGGVALFNIMLGEIIFGGVGSGLYGMILFAILTVFLAGLMVGRTPEYLGKKIEARDIRWTLIGILAPSAVILIGAGISAVLPVALSSLANEGPHGLTEILYAFSSAAGNNGSAFAGLNANTPYYNVALGLAMLFGRFVPIVAVIMIADSLARKTIAPISPGTFRTDAGLFVILLAGVILIVGGLTFFPALSLGPIMEHFLMYRGVTF